MLSGVPLKKQMQQADNPDLLFPLVPKAHNSECQNLTSLQIKPEKGILKLVCRFLYFRH